MSAHSNELIGLVMRPYSLLSGCRSALIVVALSIAAAICFPAQVVFSAPILYGDFMGDTVTYVGVSEDANSNDTPPLFGAPTVSGDSLDFDPLGFDANATGVNGIDITSGQLLFMIDAKEGKNITSLSISEAGDTTLSGFGTNSTFTAVNAAVFVDVFEVNGVEVNNLNFSDSVAFSPQGGLYQLGNNGGGPSFHTIWTGSLFIDFDDILADAGISGRATKVGININNTLSAGSEAGTFALIAKKDFGGLSITVNGPNPGPGGGPEIPEPASAILVGLGLCLAAARRGRLG